MKSYLLILLATLGFGGLFSSFTEAMAVDAEFVSTPETSEIISVNSAFTMELENISELALAELEDTPVMTSYAPVYTSVVQSSHATPAALYYTSVASSTPNFTVTVRNDSYIVKSPSYSDIYRFRNLLYAHNSSNLFGALSSYAPGTVFNVTEGGVTSSYRVSEVRVFQKIDDSTLYLCYNNNYADCHGSNQLVQIAKSSSYINESLTLSRHSLALMTCSGTSYGNGDASHRLVVFADQI